MRAILNSIRNRYLAWLDSALESFVDPSAKITISKNNVSLQGKIRVGKNSTLTIEDGVQFHGKMIIGENCKVHIFKGCHFLNSSISVLNQGEVIISSDCQVSAPANEPNTIVVDNGKLFFSNNVHLQAELLVRFGGELRIGAYTSINSHSEIRCEQLITIGEYCLISYDVCIYDTNAHSTDWKHRRDTIHRDALEIEKPSTKPVYIGDDCWIGKGATILKGVNLGARSIVGIRTVVPSGLYPEGCKVVSGKPVLL